MFKQFETLSKFRPDLSPDSLLMFSVVLPPVVIEQPYTKEKDHRYSIRSRVSCQWP